MSELTIFEQLRRAGMSVAGALGTMGNMGEESGLEACRVQGDFTSDRIMSKDYANKVDSGVIGDDSFANDGKGWGLVQFTWPGYKRGLLALCRRTGTSIADETAQIAYFVGVLKTEFSALWSFLCSCGDDQLYTATDRVFREFERPAVNNVAARFKAAKELRAELQGKAVEEIDNGIERYWPPRELCEGMNGPDVSVMQSILKARGYTLSGTGGVFGPSSTAALKKFQEDKHLDVDGICGKVQSWPALLKM